MKLSHKGYARHARRVANRVGTPFVKGSTVVIKSDEYGKSYNNCKAVFERIHDGFAVVQPKRRKSPLYVRLEHLQAA